MISFGTSPTSSSNLLVNFFVCFTILLFPFSVLCNDNSSDITLDSTNLSVSSHEPTADEFSTGKPTPNESIILPGHINILLSDIFPETSSDYLLSMDKTNLNTYQLSLPKGKSIEGYIENILDNFPPELLGSSKNTNEITDQLKRSFSTFAYNSDYFNDKLITMTIFELYELLLNEWNITNESEAASICSSEYPKYFKTSCSCLLYSTFANGAHFSAKVYLPKKLDVYLNECAAKINSYGFKVHELEVAAMEGLVLSDYEGAIEISWKDFNWAILRYKSGSAVISANTPAIKSASDSCVSSKQQPKPIDMSKVYVIFNDFGLVSGFLNEKEAFMESLKNYSNLIGCTSLSEAFKKWVYSGILANEPQFKPSFKPKYLVFEKQSISVGSLIKIIEDVLFKKLIKDAATDITVPSSQLLTVAENNFLCLKPTIKGNSDYLLNGSTKQIETNSQISEISKKSFNIKKWIVPITFLGIGVGLAATLYR